MNVSTIRSSQLPQECRDHVGDIVVGRIRKSSRESIELRLRTITGKRVVLMRLCRMDATGAWRPLNDSCRCGLTVRAELLSGFIDLLEMAEDKLADEGVLP